MSVFGKLAFWKKDDLGLGDLPKDIGGAEEGQPQSQGMSQPSGWSTDQHGLGEMSMQNSFNSGFERPQALQSFQREQQGVSQSKDLELIASKLDAIRMAIENLSQRLANLERVTYGDGQPRRKHDFFQDMPPRTF